MEKIHYKNDRNFDSDKLDYAIIVKSIYLGILNREADEYGLNNCILALKNGENLSDIIRNIIQSDEFSKNHQTGFFQPIELPNLTEQYPEKYYNIEGNLFFKVSSDVDFYLLESLIKKHRYYDSFGVWSPSINCDKHFIASIVLSLGAQSCLEIGCFSGAVLSLLADKGVDICGTEISHLAFLLAYPNTFEKIIFGELTEIPFSKCYDVIIAMDILEHINPLKINNYVIHINRLLNERGFLFINSPMFGYDSIFGKVFDCYHPEWCEIGDRDFWRNIHCDLKGWPLHGHLIWASPEWWESLFFYHGLVRDKNIEYDIHKSYKSFFEKIAPARKSFFILRKKPLNQIMMK